VLAAGSFRQIIESWNALLPAPLDTHTLEKIASVFDRDAVSLIPVVEPLRPCLELFRSSGYLLGIATMDNEEGAHAMVEEMGVADLFDFICGADSGHGEKPDPGMVMAFAERLEGDPREVAMVGDSPRDILMGHNANAGLSVGVASGAHSETELRQHTNHVLPHIGHLRQYLNDFDQDSL